MARSGSYTYDPKTGKWTHNTSGTSTSKQSSNGSSNSSSPPKSSGSSNLSSKSTNSDSSSGDVETKYNTIEYNTLEGTLNYIATEETIKINPGDTIRLEGLGNTLSGLYYVQDVTRSVSSSGYSHSATLIKTDFGSSLKLNTTSTPPVSGGSNPTNKATKKVTSSANTSNTSTRTHVLQRGECLWGLARKYYGNGALFTRIAQANNISASQYKRIPIGTRLIIP